MRKPLPPLIKTLHDPSLYPHPVSHIKLIQTHISYLLLAGEYVYKIKKPLNLGFLDFSTLEQRKYYCEKELSLNRRLCPTIYLAVLPIFFDGETYNWQGNGKIIEYCLQMSRMPEEKMMNRVISEGLLTRKEINRIIDVIEPFYDYTQGGVELAQFGTSGAVGRIVMENLRQTKKFIDSKALNKAKYDSIHNYSLRFLKKSNLFNKRIQSGKIKDCHGDLHSANICLADQVYIYDCIEFNNRYRFSDIAADLAFLAMDLDYNKLNDLSSYLINRYIADSGDDDIMNVLNFYKCYRATVRGKIGLLTAHESEMDNKTKANAIKQAASYFSLAQQYAND